MNDSTQVNIGRDANGNIIVAGKHNIVIQKVSKEDLSEEFPFRLYNIPDKPPNFIPRPEILDSLKQKILLPRGSEIDISSAIKVGIHGMGGIGKTVLAAVLARDESVQKHFADGIYWIVLGQTPDIVSRQKQLAQAISRKPEDFIDVHVGKAKIGELLSDRSCLVVLDDVWEMNHAAAFNALGSGSQLLITTRNANLITGLGADRCTVELLTLEQARLLLSNWSNKSSLPLQADDVIKECGFLPIGVAMVGAMLRDKPLSRWDSVLSRLQNADIKKISQEFPNYPYPNLFAVFEVSVEAIQDPILQERYLDFAVFPEDTPIPSTVLHTLWGDRGMDKEEIEDSLYILADRSLLQIDKDGVILLHDLQWDYVRAKVKENLAALHQQMLNAYERLLPSNFSEEEV